MTPGSLPKRVKDVDALLRCFKFMGEYNEDKPRKHYTRKQTSEFTKKLKSNDYADISKMQRLRSISSILPCSGCKATYYLQLVTSTNELDT